MGGGSWKLDRMIDAVEEISKVQISSGGYGEENGRLKKVERKTRAK